MKMKPVAAFVASVFFLPWVMADKIYQSDSSGNINQINIGVGKTNYYSDSDGGNNSEPGAKEMQLSPFSKLVIRVPSDVIYEQSSRNMVTLSGPAGALEKIRVRQSGGSLIIDSQKNFHTNGGIEIKVSGTGVDQLELSGAIDAELKHIKSRQFSLSMDGAVDVTAQGQVGQCTIELFGSGDADLEDLKCDAADVRLEGSSDLHIHASERITGRLTGAADVTVSGNPRVRKLSALGAVDISYD